MCRVKIYSAKQIKKWPYWILGLIFFLSLTPTTTYAMASGGDEHFTRSAILMPTDVNGVVDWAFVEEIDDEQDEDASVDIRDRDNRE